MSDEEKDVDEVEEDETEEDEVDDDDDELAEEQGILVDHAVATSMEQDGMFTGGDGYELKCLIVKNDENAQDKINKLFSEKDKRGLLRIRSIQDTLITDKTVFIWYYE
jgi:hypothetical protein